MLFLCERFRFALGMFFQCERFRGSASAVFLFEDTANPATKNTVNASLVYLAGVTANARIEVPHSMGPWEAHLGASKGGT